jgi:hypothetical protein
VWKYLRSRPHAWQCPEISTFATKVWFERADRIDGILPHSPYFSHKVGFKLVWRIAESKSWSDPDKMPHPSNSIRLPNGDPRTWGY